jgi:hypothetical protein
MRFQKLVSFTSSNKETPKLVEEFKSFNYSCSIMYPYISGIIVLNSLLIPKRQKNQSYIYKILQILPGCTSINMANIHTVFKLPPAAS